MPCEGDPGISPSSIYDVTVLGNKVPCPNLVRSSGRSLMSIVGAFDLHRRQLTFEYLDMVSGELDGAQKRQGGAGRRPHPRASATSMITLPGAGRAR
jgi:hypothetical protein